jgi:hypothetical protein
MMMLTLVDGWNASVRRQIYNMLSVNRFDVGVMQSVLATQTSDVVGKDHRVSINRPTKRGKENSRSDGHFQCEKEMEEHLLACQ